MKKNLNVAYLNGAEGITRKSSSGGNNVSLMKEVTYAELKELRDGGKLVAGQMYRMTDYETTTSQEGTQSAGHPFDLILTALDEKTLDEKCSAIQSARDTEGYFANSNLAAWQVWYSLDNDIKYSWAVPKGLSIGVDFSEWDEGVLNCFYADTFIYNGEQYHKWVIPYWGDYCYVLTKTKMPNIGENTIYVDIVDGEIDYEEEVGFVSSVSESDGGKGVIYRMIDDACNDLPYDFKNIMFTRKITDGYLDDEYGVETFVYTFNYFKDSVCGDYTVVNPSCCYMNRMLFNILLPNNVFLNKMNSYCCDNTFGGYCNNNTFGFDCDSNTFGNFCDSNTFGNYCYGNIFGGYCNNNTFGGECNNNTFDSDCNNNTLGSDCYGKNIELKDGVQHIKLSASGSSSSRSCAQNYEIKGISGTSGSPIEITLTRNNPFTTYISKSSNGDIIQYTDEDIYNAINK